MTTNLNERVLAHMKAVGIPQHSTHVAEALGVDNLDALGALLNLVEAGELEQIPWNEHGAVRWVLA
jgi:hypothetical protein